MTTKIKAGVIGDGVVGTTQIADDAITSAKLDTNIAVAGTLTVTGDANFDSNTLFVDSSANAVGIGTSSPETLLHVQKSSTALYTSSMSGASSYAPSDADMIQVRNSNTGLDDIYAGIWFETGTGATNTTGSDRAGRIALVVDNDSSYSSNFVFQTRGTAGTLTEKMRITQDGNVGIGTTSIDEKLHVQVASGDAALKLEDATSYMRLDQNSIGADTVLRFKTGSNLDERVRILSSGGITFNGETAADHALDDYEEGTWTPALVTSGGVTTNSISTYGIFTKIGNLVHIHAKISATLSSLPGQTFQISGLPFSATNSSDTEQREIIAIGGDCANLGSLANGRAHFRTNGSQLQGVYMNSGSTAYWTYNTMDSSSFELHISGTYRH